MTDLNCDETVAEHQRSAVVDSKAGSMYHHQTPSVIVQLPNFYNLKTNKSKFAPAYDSNSEDSLGKPPHDILSDTHSDKVLSATSNAGGGRAEILDSSKLLLCYSTSAYNAGSGGGKGGPQFRFSGLPEAEEMDRNLMHIMVDGGGSEIFKDDDVLKSNDKVDSFVSRLDRQEHGATKDELHHMIHKMDGGAHAELSFNFSRANQAADDDDRVLKRRELGHFDEEDERRLLDGDVEHSEHSNRDRHVLDSGQNSNYIETSRSSEYATLTPLLLPLPPISNLIRRDMPSGVVNNKPKHVTGDHTDFSNGIDDQQRGLSGGNGGVGDDGSGVRGGNDGNNGVNGPGSADDKSKGGDGDTSPFFSFQGANNHNSLAGDDHGLMLGNAEQYHSRYIDITLPEMENSDMGGRVITNYMNTSPSQTPLNSGTAGQLNFFYDATNNFQAQHEINENIIGQDSSISGHRTTPKLSPTGGQQCPKGVLTNGLILLNQAQASEDLILDGIDADFVSSKGVFKTNNLGHRIRVGDDNTLSNNVHSNSRIVHHSMGVEKKRSDYYASKYNGHENQYHDDGHMGDPNSVGQRVGGGSNNNNNNNNNNHNHKDPFNNGSLGEEKLKQPHTEYLDMQSVDEVVAHSSHHKYQSRKRECNDGTRSPGVSMSSLENEEINTKELAQKISAELKRYSIPQAIFAQRVLCRSQVRSNCYVRIRKAVLIL